MPLSKGGNKALKAMKQEYGDKKGEQVFYAKQNKDQNFKKATEGKKRK
jgi:hypothetical protein